MSSAPRIPRYDLKEEVGSGGMSVVYRAVDTSLDREVAVKVLHRHLASKEAERQRFRQEAQAVARLKHPNILEIHDYSGESSEEAYIVSEFIRGPTVRQFAETVGFGLPEIGVLVAERLAGALEHAHALGVIHRDLKPENVMVQDDGTVKLTDFGVARMVDRDERMTMTGALLGSPAHMAPETIEGHGADVRSDVFSLGTVLYWLACGALPFHGGSPAEVLRRIAEGRYEDPRRVDPRVSDELGAIIDRAMARDPAARYPSALALGDALRGYLADCGIESPADELADFFADPATVKVELAERLVERLLERAHAAAAAGDWPGAVRACDRVLALEPGNAAAAECLAAVHRRRRRRRIAFGTAGAVGAASAVAIAVGLWPATPPAPASPAPAAAATTTPATRTPAVEHPPAAKRLVPAKALLATGPSAIARPKTPAPHPTPIAHPAKTPEPHAGRHVAAAHPRTPAHAAHRLVRILVEPFAAISVDGELLARDREAKRALPLGDHSLSIERDGFVPIEEPLRVVAGTGPEVVRRRLVPKPAVLHIENAQHAAVSVDGQLKGTVEDGGLDLPVTFPEGPGRRYRLEVSVEVRLEKLGFAPMTRKVVVKPGQHVSIQATLEPEK